VPVAVPLAGCEQLRAAVDHRGCAHDAQQLRPRGRRARVPGLVGRGGVGWGGVGEGGGHGDSIEASETKRSAANEAQRRNGWRGAPREGRLSPAPKIGGRLLCCVSRFSVGPRAAPRAVCERGKGRRRRGGREPQAGLERQPQPKLRQGVDVERRARRVGVRLLGGRGRERRRGPVNLRTRHEEVSKRKLSNVLKPAGQGY
jgi:hypothetical protein